MLGSLLHHKVDWERPEITIDEALGSVRTYMKQQQNIRCLVQPLTSREQSLFAQRQVNVSHFVFFDRLLALQTGDRLLYKQKAGLPVRYLIINGWEDQGGQNGRCFCVRAYELM